MECPICNGNVEHLGRWGRSLAYRCRRCGYVFAQQRSRRSWADQVFRAAASLDTFSPGMVSETKKSYVMEGAYIMHASYRGPVEIPYKLRVKKSTGEFKVEFPEERSLVHYYGLKELEHKRITKVLQ